MSDKFFWAKVDKGPHPKGCWVWKGYCQAFGHGAIQRVVDGKPKTILAHRRSWTLLVGPLPARACLLHHCDNPPCVNPEHLYIGTRQDNMRDKVDRNRTHKGQDSALSKLTDAQVLEIRRLRGVVVASELAKRFGVSQNYIYQIQRREVWKHL